MKCRKRKTKYHSLNYLRSVERVVASPWTHYEEDVKVTRSANRLLDELGLPLPQATIVRNRAEFDRPWQYPFYLKLAHSTAGAGVFYIVDRASLDHRVGELTRPGVDPYSRLPLIWIAVQLLIWPAIARRIVAKTVKNYSMPESAIDSIQALPLDLLDGGREDSLS